MATENRRGGGMDNAGGLRRALGRRRLADTPAPPLGWRTMVIFSMGAMSNGLKQRAFGAFLLIFYNQVIGLPAASVGAVIMVALVVDGLVNPIVGVTSDHLRTPLGRRHFLMYAAALPYGVLFYLTWNPPAGMSGHWLLAYLAICVIGVRIADTFYEVPASALVPELASDYDKRTRLVSIRYFCGFLGSFVCSLAAYHIFLRRSAENPEGLLGPAGYGHLGAFGAVFIIALILLSTGGTHWRIPWLRDPADRRVKLGALISEAMTALANRSFWVATTSGVFLAVATGFASGLSMYFNLYFWELGADKLAVLVTAGLSASFVGVAIAPWFISRLGKKAGAMVLFAAVFLVHIAPVSLRLLGLLPANGSPFVLGLLIGESFLSGGLTLMLNIAITSMLADLTEDIAVKTGRRAEGLVTSADDFLKKATSGVGIFVSSLMLTVVGFPEKAKPGEVSAQTLHQLGLVFVPTMAILYLGALACLLAYRIDRQVHEQNLAALRAMEPPASQG